MTRVETQLLARVQGALTEHQVILDAIRSDTSED